MISPFPFYLFTQNHAVVLLNGRMFLLWAKPQWDRTVVEIEGIRIVEYPWLEGTHKDQWVQLPAQHRTTQKANHMSKTDTSSTLATSVLWLLPWKAYSNAQPSSPWRTLSWFWNDTFLWRWHVCRLLFPSGEQVEPLSRTGFQKCFLK